MLFLLAGFVLVTGCKSRPPANVKHVSLQIFEVIDCTPKMVPMTLRGKTEKYCLAGEPVVSETDIRSADALHSESGDVRLALFITSKAGQHLKETTERITAEHLQRHDDGKMGIVIDGTLVDAPVVRGVISDSIVIDGAFSWDEANQIADSLRGRG